MESIQRIKARIHSIGITRQITQSMRLVSSSKVQKARNRMVDNQPFLANARQMASSVLHNRELDRHPYVAARPVKTSAVIVISGDRGLCGSYNAAVGKSATQLVKSLGDCRIITIGSKAKEYCQRRRGSAVAQSFIGMSEKPFFEDAQEIASLALDWYKKGQVDQIYMVYTEYVSAIEQNPKAEKLLPLGSGEREPGSGFIEFEPDVESFVERAVPFYVAGSLYGAMLEASACEQSARLTSMDSAVKNSDEMIASLTLLYNQARQAAITQEIIEIVSGAETL
ncbi:ATP synthase F1 subunit gamma [Oscillospiraceae bacterium MB08-C2-2]|nr:ATP synthase F1 subunit gamma [Oscillospiraceae bacterium MB08-C2-2]